MNRNALAATLVAGLVLLAGCSSGFTGSTDGTAADDSALDGETTAEGIEGETGTLNMYISDERNDIDDFEQLNVTITRVGVKPAGEESDDGDADDSDDSDADDSDEADDAEDDTETTGANATESVETETETPDAEDEGIESDEAADDAAEAGAEDGEGEWIEYEVDSRTVDLTELKGANATKLSSLDVPNGSYDKVFVYVSEVEGTLKDGSDQRVKLPSGKLQLNSEFTVGDGESVDFVLDITAVKAGNSGKYILKPVISESGTDVEIDDVNEREDGERAAELNASFDGDVVAGENVTLRVTSDGEPVEGATVSVGGERVGTTDADGAYVIQVPDGAEELEVEVTDEDREAEVTVELDEESDSSDTDDEPDATATTHSSV